MKNKFFLITLFIANIYCIVEIEWNLRLGNGSIDDRGHYVPQGIPGARWYGVAEINSEGTVFICSGYFSPFVSGTRYQIYYSDLWTLKDTFFLWTDPVDSKNSQGSCDPLDTYYTPANTILPATWTNGTDFWLFGGLTRVFFPANPPFGILADLWKFSPETGLWTWITAPNNNSCITNPFPDPTVPVGRYGAVTWVTNNELYMFGGNSTNGVLNDMWKYNGKWEKLFSGTKSGYYVEKRRASNLSFPSARAFASKWVDLDGNLWIYGGVTDKGTILNDLWRFDLDGKWTWFSGNSDIVNVSPIYGKQSRFCGDSQPGSRQGAATWSDAKGRLWLFGGSIDMNNTYNDFWLFDPIAVQWSWISGSQEINAMGDYNSVNPFPGGLNYPMSWIDLDQNLVLYAGHTPQGAMNDMWKAKISGDVDPCDTD